MKAYNPNRPCPKCGGSAMTSYAGHDTLTRTCARCGYRWDEKALDAAERRGEDG